MRKFLQVLFVGLMWLSVVIGVQAQQVPNANFEDWSGAAFNGEPQPKSWNASNVEQVGMKFNFAHKETGRNGGYCMMVQDQDVGAMGITATSPGYFALGQPWAYLPSISEISKATAGTSGGISWNYRPDSMSVWIKRTGNDNDKEDFYLLYYAWSGTAKGTSYKNKTGQCTPHEETNEESDVRQALNGNECQTSQYATQVCEGMWRERHTYSNWTNIKVPIYYMNNTVPTMLNIIFSASNYPNYRANDGLYAGNSLYVDDVELIYSSRIQKLYVDGKEWKGFDPYTTEVQYYSLGESATAIPSIEAVRGAGSITNAHNETVNFSGRTLGSDEVTVENGDLVSKPTKITVKSVDGGKSTTVYLIQFQKAASSNAKLADITVNGNTVTGFKPDKYNYNVELPYGTTAAPVVAAEGQEDKQTIQITQATSPTGKATIQVTAANGTAKATYTLNFSVAQLSDNTLQDILVNDKSVPGFTPTQTVYKVSLPESTTTMPTVKAVSAYLEGEQTITYTAPAVIDGGTYQISVTTPGNTIAKVYKLNFKLEKSSYTYLNDLLLDGVSIAHFEPTNFTYYINLPMGTTQLPAITWVPGDEFQTITLNEGGLDGTTRITVTAGNGDQSVYKIIFSTEKSTNSHLEGILIGGEPLTGFDPNITTYTYSLPVGTTQLPTIEPIPGDEYQSINVTTAGLNGKTRITVTAGDGSTTVYQIQFSVTTYTDNTLKNLQVVGYEIGFQPEKNEYTVKLDQETTELPEVIIELQNAQYQDTTVRRPNGLIGDFRITVRPLTGASRTYVIHFTMDKSDNTALSMIYIDGEPIANFHPDTLHYIDSLAEGVTTLPTVTYDPAENTQTVSDVLDKRTLHIFVTAQSGATREYTVRFVNKPSQNAALKMIYLDGDSLDGFDPKTLNYTVQLTGETCPVITVDKVAGQQVTITTPYAAGVASIKVKPEEGEINTYTIEFEQVAPATVRLSDILIDNVSLDGFVATQRDYTATYAHSLPDVQGVAENDRQTIQVLWRDETALLYVQDEEGNSTVYSISFNRLLSGNSALEAIYANGELIEGFAPDKQNYAYALEAGSTYPVITYQVADNASVVFFGQLAEGKWGITVVAENDTKTEYSVQYTIAQYDDATLLDMDVEGYDLPFDPSTPDYTLSIDDGKNLPTVTVVTRPKQTAFISNVDDAHQKVVVCAESGATGVYTITYNRVKSSNALLQDILINGESLAGFAEDRYDYSIELAHGTKVVPNIFPVGQLENQTITTAYSRPNGVTRIHVEAQDGASADYTITFSVPQSSNTKLGELIINGDLQNVDQIEFEFTLPYGSYAPYDLSYTKAEPEQTIHYTAAPIGAETKLVVVAENGDTRTYTIRYRVAQPEGANVLKRVDYTYINSAGDPVDGSLVPQAGENKIDLPFGAKSFSVTHVEKNYTDQSYVFYNGGIRRGATIIVSSNRDNEPDVTYSITPRIPEFDTKGKLKELKFKNALVPHWRSDVYNYIVGVEDQPISDDFTFVKYDENDAVTKSDIDAVKKQMIISVTGGETYSICWFYTKDGKYKKDGAYYDYLDFSQEWEPTAQATMWKSSWTSNATANGTMSTGFKPHGWIVPADKAAGLEYEIDLSIFGKVVDLFWYTGKEVIAAGTNGAMLSTINGASINGSMPGMMTLGGTMSVKPEKKGGSTSSISYNAANFITMRNTPDSLSMRYKSLSQSNVSGWYYELRTVAGATRVDKFPGNFSSATWRYASLPITAYGEAMSKYALTINSCHTENAGDMTGSDKIYSSDLQIENVHFVYNSDLTGVKVDGADAEQEGNTFTIDAEADYVAVPALKFTGAVHDQMQVIDWLYDGEWKDGQLTAKVTNYGENMADNTVYTVVLKRAPVTSLNYDVEFGSYTSTESVDGDTTFVALPYGMQKLPDVTITPESVHQRFALSKNGQAVTITVTAENDQDSTHVYVFHETKSDNVNISLQSEDDDVQLNTEDAENFIYSVTATRMPVISFVKEEAGQTVVLQYTEDGATLVVTAPNGITQRTYTIQRLEQSIETSAVITEFEVGSNVVPGFGGVNDSIESVRPEEAVSFTRQFASDSVVFVQAPTRMEWRVFGSVEKKYIWQYPTAQSANTDLDNILVDGNPLSDFVASTEDYDLLSDSSLVIVAVPSENSQKVVTAVEKNANGIVYTTVVTAENGDQKTYTVTITEPKSNVATLAGILLDGVLVENFNPETKNYQVMLPVGAIKTEEPAMPSITYLVGQAGQTVSLEYGALNGDPTVFNVVSEDGTATMMYQLTIESEKSHCTDLTGIIVNGVAIEHFESGRHFYSVSLNTEEFEIDYTADDRFFRSVDTLVTVVKPGHEYLCVLRVTAEDGTQADYQVAIYVENRSSDAQLANIYLDEKAFDDYRTDLNPDLKAFDPGKNEYHINIEDTVPMVRAELKMAGQSVDIIQDSSAIFLHVYAVDSTLNIYKLYFEKKLSTVTDLSMITVNGDSLDFNPNQHFYTYELQLGDDWPNVRGWAVDESKQTLTTVNDQEKNQVTINVVAEDTTYTSIYMVSILFTPSEVDTLDVIYENEPDTLPGFTPNIFYYTRQLPVGSSFPSITYGERYPNDGKWPTLDSMTVEKSNDIWVHQTIVTAQSGKKNTYTLSYSILKSDVDTLQMILVDKKPLQSFKATTLDYTYELTAEQANALDGALPEVDYIEGDEYQTVLVSQAPDELDNLSPGYRSLGYKSLITVTAQSGANKTYTIHYPVELSSETLLNMILLGGKPLSNFDSERFSYKEEIEENASIPVITVAKKDDAQVVDLIMVEDTVHIQVTAENGDQAMYSIMFERQKSSVVLLRNIVLKDAEGEPLSTGLFAFRPETYEYEIILPYDPTGADELPTIEYERYDSLQVVEQVQYELPNGDVMVVLQVTAANGEDEGEYALTFHFTRNNDARLADLLIEGVTMEGFESLITEYEYRLPYGTDSTAFLSPEKITYTLSDSLATSTMWMDEDATIFIRVVAQDGTTELTYIIRQIVGLDDDNALVSIELDGVLMADFDSEKTFYTYYLMNGQNPPAVTAEARSENAEVSIREVPAGDTCVIICTAMDGSVRRYHIHFAISSTNADLMPTEKDVLIRRIPGAMQLFVATIRKDVTFVLYDPNGHLMYTEKVPVADPNKTEIYTDANGQEALGNVPDNQSGLVVDIVPGQIYSYVFFSSKGAIKSGKLIAW